MQEQRWVAERYEEKKEESPEREELTGEHGQLAGELRQLLEDKAHMDDGEGECTESDYDDWEERYRDVCARLKELDGKITELDEQLLREAEDEVGPWYKKDEASTPEEQDWEVEYEEPGCGCEEPDWDTECDGPDYEEEGSEAPESDGDEEEEDEKKWKHPRLSRREINQLLKPWMVRRRPYTRGAGRPLTRVIHPWELDRTSVRQSSKSPPLPEPTSYGGIAKPGGGAVRPEHVKENWWLKTLHETLADSNRLTGWEQEMVRQANEGVPDIDEPTGYDPHFILEEMGIDGEPVRPALFEGFKQWASEHFSAEELGAWEGGGVWPRFRRWVEHLSHEQIENIHSAWLDVQNNAEGEPVPGTLFDSHLLPGADINIESEPSEQLDVGGFTGVPEDPTSPGAPGGVGGPGDVPVDPLTKPGIGPYGPDDPNDPGDSTAPPL